MTISRTQIVLNTPKTIINTMGPSKIKEIAKKCRPIMKKYGVIKAGIFGSYARGEQKKSSDIDILVHFRGNKSYFDLISLEDDLKLILKKKVDLITYRSINHLLKERILSEEVRII